MEKVAREMITEVKIESLEYDMVHKRKKPGTRKAKNILEKYSKDMRIKVANDEYRSTED